MTGRKRAADDLGRLSKRRKLLGGSQSQDGTIPPPSQPAAPPHQSDNDGNNGGNLSSQAVPVTSNAAVQNMDPQNQSNVDGSQQVPQHQVQQQPLQQQQAQQLSNATTTANSFPHNPRVSVGPAFATAPLVDQNFREALIRRRLASGKPKGFWNTGNVCYRNAVLTALLSTEVVKSYLAYWRASRVYKELHVLPQHSILYVLQLLARDLFEWECNPEDLNRKMLDMFWRRFCYPREKNGQPSSQLEGSWRSYCDDFDASSEARQHDAHDFLMWLFQEIARQFMATDRRGRPLSSSERFDWLAKSRQVTRTICETCKHRVELRSETITADFFLLLSVPSGHGKLEVADLITSALRQKVELRCPRCKKASDCMRETKFQHTPPLLIMRLAQARVLIDGKERKDPRPVQIPEKLDMSPHLNVHEFGEGSRVTYTLSSVVSHQGGFKRGHYKSYVRGGLNQQVWFELDDDNVTQVPKFTFDDSEAQNLAKANFNKRFLPNILFYERDLDEDTVVSGRAAFNIGEGENDDIRPSQWPGDSQQVTSGDGDEITASSHTSTPANINLPTDGNTAPTSIGATVAANSTTVPSPSSKVSDGWISGLDEDEDHSPAVVEVTITVGGIEIPLPRQIISQFNQAKRRDIRIEAKLRTPTCFVKRFIEENNQKEGAEEKSTKKKSTKTGLGSLEYVELDLVEAQEQSLKRAGEGKRSKAKPKDWRLMWLRTGHDADTDLNSEEVREVQRLQEAKTANAADKQ